MDEKAQKIMVDLLQKASDGIDSAVSFSQAQIPDVVNELLVWNATTSILFQILAIATIAGYFLSIKKASEISRGYSDFYVVAVFYIVIGGAATFVMFIGFWLNFDWLKIWLAPKLYLIEYAASLVK